MAFRDHPNGTRAKAAQLGRNLMLSSSSDPLLTNQSIQPNQSKLAITQIAGIEQSIERTIVAPDGRSYSRRFNINSRDLSNMSKRISNFSSNSKKKPRLFSLVFPQI